MIPLLILGLIKQNPGSYGYELLSMMENRHYKYIVNFTKGSFYYNLQKLEEKQYIKRIEIFDNVRETQNYIITEIGEHEFERLIKKYGTKTEYINLSFYAALLFADEYEKDELKKIIEAQIEQTKERVLLLEKSIKEDKEVSTYFKKMMENSRSHHLVNIEWFEYLLETI